jgi:predicted phage terminase large subunit-like protein
MMAKEELDLPPLDEYALLASVCRESFADFVRHFWHVCVDDKLVWNWHMQYLCDELQIMAERVFAWLPKLHDMIVNISPGSSKSLIASVMYQAWCWTRKPGLVLISISYSSELSVELSRKSRDLIKSDLYRKCFPEVQISDDQDAKGHFINTKKGERIAASTGGRLMGQHGHIIVVDDPLNPEEAASDTELANTNRWMQETLPSRKKDKSIAPTILIMQRLHEFDPTGVRLKKKIPVKHICFPAELTDDVKPEECRKFYVDGLMDPNRLGWDVLYEYEQQGSYLYASQFLQTPIPRGGAMFLVDQIKTENKAPRMAKLIRGWDKAGTQGGGAFTAGVLMGLDMEGNYWVLDVVRGQWDSGRRERVIQDTARKDGFKTIIVVEQEPGSGGKESVEGSIRQLSGYRVRKYKVGKSDGDKEARADAFSAQVNIGRLYLLKGPWNESFIEEMKHFPRSRFKDQIDAASSCFNHLAVKTIKLGGLRGLRNGSTPRPAGRRMIRSRNKEESAA